MDKLLLPVGVISSRRIPVAPSSVSYENESVQPTAAHCGILAMHCKTVKLPNGVKLFIYMN